MNDNEKLQYETLESIRIYLNHFIEGLDICSKNLQVNKNDEGIKLLGKIIDGLDWLLNALRLTKTVQKNIISTIEIEEQIRVLLDALENGDIILVSDLLQYEIKPILEKWKIMLEDVSDADN